jgi:hypothetical protein
MSIFPTRILLATDGSEEAEMAAKTTVGLAQRTGSELHVIHILALPLDTQDPSSFEPGWRRQLETRARSELKDEVDTIEASGGAVADTHLGVGRPDAEIVALAEEMSSTPILFRNQDRPASVARAATPTANALLAGLSTCRCNHRGFIATVYRESGYYNSEAV